MCFRVEQETAKDALPGHIGLMSLVGDCVKELLEVRLKLTETWQAQIRHNIVDHNQLFECYSLVINQLQNGGEVRVLASITLDKFSRHSFKSLLKTLLHTG